MAYRPLVHLFTARQPTEFRQRGDAVLAVSTRTGGAVAEKHLTSSEQCQLVLVGLDADRDRRIPAICGEAERVILAKNARVSTSLPPVATGFEGPHADPPYRARTTPLDLDAGIGGSEDSLVHAAPANLDDSEQFSIARLRYSSEPHLRRATALQKQTGNAGADDHPDPLKSTDRQHVRSSVSATTPAGPGSGVGVSLHRPELVRHPLRAVGMTSSAGRWASVRQGGSGEVGGDEADAGLHGRAWEFQQVVAVFGVGGDH